MMEYIEEIGRMSYLIYQDRAISGSQPKNAKVPLDSMTIIL